MEAEIEKKIGEVNAANNKIIADYQADIDRKLKGLVSEAAFADLKGGYEKRWAELDTVLAKLQTPNLAPPEKPGAVEMKAFHKFLGGGILTPEERKVLTIADATHAGVLAPYEYVQQILKYVTVYSPIRRLATVRQTSRYDVEIPTETAIGVATWVAESAEKTETTGQTYALTDVKLFEMKQLYKATQHMLEDAVFNIEAELAGSIGRAMGLLEGTAFVSGDGTTAPEGIITNTTCIAAKYATAASNAIAIADLLGIYYQLKAYYIPNATWLWARSTTAEVAALKNATTNSYLIQPNLMENQPAQLFGCPIVECPDFPDQVTDSAYIAAFGDIRAGYTIVDRVDIVIQRLIEKYAEFGMIGFLARKRVGGKVVIPEAIQLLQAKA